MEISDGQIRALRQFVATDAGAKVVLAMVLQRPPSEVTEQMCAYIDALTPEQREWELMPNA
jgi:hypothetical protein